MIDTLKALNPYGVNRRERMVAPTTHMIYQGETKKLTFVMPESYAAYDTNLLRFVIVDTRFKRDILFTAADNNYAELPTPEDPIKIEVTIPAGVTAIFRRGSFLYSLEVKSILGDERTVVEEGSITVEYHAGAPDPDVPYKNPDYQDETQNDG